MAPVAEEVRVFRRPVFWVAFTVLALACATFAVRNFPRAFSLVELDLDMDRETALSEARRLAAQLEWGPSDFRQAASFRLDDRARSFVELEAGGAEAFTGLLREGPFHPYQWVVRHFRAGEVREVEIRFRPDGAPYGFRERLSDDAPGAALDADDARAIAESHAGSPWNVALDSYALVESSQQEQPQGRIDHTFVYERADVVVGDGRFRLRLVVSGDRFTELTHVLQIPEAFDRRYAEMRSANEGITIGGSFAMLLIYGIGGIGVGLFVLLRQRWVLWRTPLLWGASIACTQLLVGLNSWPLLWMEYDTAVSQTSFALQQVALLGALFLAFTGVFALSFMAAESLSRRAFPHHIQLWRVWSLDAARSWQVLGQTVAGYLIVGVDLAFLVTFYWFVTRYLGWWSPSDALLNPDSLATVFPWLDPIALSLQAGFWEECLFRAVPLAGAALLGNRFGGRRAWITAAFVVQIVIFGAGHAAYPTQPSYARLIELIVPSTIFGLLYLRFGLLPAIVMHFAFDAVLFGIPLFVSSAPGAWVDQGIFLLLVLVPVWVVLSARLRGGGWIGVPSALLNRTWSPPEPAAPDGTTAAAPREPLGLPRFPVVAGVAVLGVGLWGYGAVTPSESPPLEVGRGTALDVARAALAERGVDVDDWRELSVVVSGLDQQDRFVWTEAGEERYRALLGEYLSGPRWRVRYARFEGDVAARAEEHIVWVAADGTLGRQEHRLAEDTAGPALSEDAARSLARDALDRFEGVASLREISAESSRRPSRTDWTFTFRDEAVGGLSGGEARVAVQIGGDEVVDTGRSIYLPEEWRRRENQRRATMSVVAVASNTLLGLLLVGGAVAAIVRWTRGQFHLETALTVAGLVLVVSVVQLANDWPSLMNGLDTAQPLLLQVGLFIVGGLIGQGVLAVLVGLLAGHCHVLAHGRFTTRADTRLAVWTGVALGVGFLGGVASVGTLFGRSLPPWSAYGPADAMVPWLTAALGPVPAYLLLTVVAMLVITSVNALTGGWARRRVVGAIALILVGALLAPGPSRDTLASWAVSGLLSGALLLVAYIWVLRSYPALVVLSTAALIVPGVVERGFERAYGGALVGSLVGVAAVAFVAWRWFRLLSRVEADTG